jgi:hypothetical protein
METYLKGFMMMALLTLTAFSCDRSEEAFAQAAGARQVRKWGNLEAVLQVTDMQGEPKSSFREGENFLLNFTVRNRGKEDAWIESWAFPAGNDFFAVYKSTNEGDGKSRIGKPFRIGANTYDGARQIVPATYEIKYAAPWMSEKGKVHFMPIYSNPKNSFTQRHYEPVEMQPLSKGKYFSGFTLEQEGKELAFRIEFEVK